MFAHVNGHGVLTILEQRSTAVLTWTLVGGGGLFLFIYVAHFKKNASTRNVSFVRSKTWFIDTMPHWSLTTSCWLCCIPSEYYVFKKYKWKMARATRPSFTWLRLQSDLVCTADVYAVCFHDEMYRLPLGHGVALCGPCSLPSALFMNNSSHSLT